MAQGTAKPSGLEGVSAGETAICKVEQHALIYRGYEIADLAEHATFEDVAHLLLVGHKPDASERKAFEDELKAEREIPAMMHDRLREGAKLITDGAAVPMDVLRTGVSVLGHLDPECQDSSAEANLRKSKRLIAKIPTIIGHMQNAIDGRDYVEPDASLGHAANLLWMMTGEKPVAESIHVTDVSLVLYAEHDFNASTFTCRVIASTLSDLHSAVCGGISALKGPLHGGANEAAMEMLSEIREAIGPENDEGKVREWMHGAFESKRKLMGFGHRVYKEGDHRAPILHALGRTAAAHHGAAYVKLFELGEMVQKIMLEEKGIFPNVDFPCGMTYFTLGIPVPQYTPIFVAARVSGWCAHVMEQHANNRLIRPRVEYTGPALRKWADG